MFFPAPRNQDDYSFTKKGANACENTRTDLTEKTVFARGQSFAPKWWWCVFSFNPLLNSRLIGQ
jgi:hypothetical protein